jgi:diguanylate cyclase (GGDEF)-like protein
MLRRYTDVKYSVRRMLKMNVLLLVAAIVLILIVFIQKDKIEKLQEEKADLQIEKIEFQEQLKEANNKLVVAEALSMEDPLTKLYNRRGFERASTDALRDAMRYQKQAMFVAIDVDNFKSINDNYGHTAGDVVLRLVAEAMNKSIRPTDVVARMGSGADEFAIILVDANEEIAQQVIARIQKKIGESIKTIDVTISSGFASIDLSKKNFKSALELAEKTADEAMYANKEAKKIARGA